MSTCHRMCMHIPYRMHMCACACTCLMCRMGMRAEKKGEIYNTKLCARLYTRPGEQVKISGKTNYVHVPMSNCGLRTYALQRGRQVALPVSLPLWPVGHPLRGAVSPDELGGRPLPADDALDCLPVAPARHVLRATLSALSSGATREAASGTCGGMSSSPRVPTRRVLCPPAAAGTAAAARRGGRPPRRRGRCAAAAVAGRRLAAALRAALRTSVRGAV